MFGVYSFLVIYSSNALIGLPLTALWIDGLSLLWEQRCVCCRTNGCALLAPRWRKVLKVCVCVQLVNLQNDNLARKTGQNYFWDSWRFKWFFPKNNVVERQSWVSWCTSHHSPVPCWDKNAWMWQRAPTSSVFPPLLLQGQGIRRKDLRSTEEWNFLWQCGCSVLSNVIATGHLWLLSTWRWLV